MKIVIPKFHQIRNNFHDTLAFHRNLCSEAIDENQGNCHFPHNQQMNQKSRFDQALI